MERLVAKMVTGSATKLSTLHRVLVVSKKQLNGALLLGLI